MAQFIELSGVVDRGDMAPVIKNMNIRPARTLVVLSDCHPARIGPCSQLMCGKRHLQANPVQRRGLMAGTGAFAAPHLRGKANAFARFEPQQARAKLMRIG